MCQGVELPSPTPIDLDDERSDDSAEEEVETMSRKDYVYRPRLRKSAFFRDRLLNSMEF